MVSKRAMGAVVTATVGVSIFSGCIGASQAAGSPQPLSASSPRTQAGDWQQTYNAPSMFLVTPSGNKECLSTITNPAKVTFSYSAALNQFTMTMAGNMQCQTSGKGAPETSTVIVKAQFANQQGSPVKFLTPYTVDGKVYKIDNPKMDMTPSLPNDGQPWPVANNWAQVKGSNQEMGSLQFGKSQAQAG